jgi:hypothetical protein
MVSLGALVGYMFNSSWISEDPVTVEWYDGSKLQCWEMSEHKEKNISESFIPEIIRCQYTTVLVALASDLKTKKLAQGQVIARQKSTYGTSSSCAGVWEGKVHRVLTV